MQKTILPKLIGYYLSVTAWVKPSYAGAKALQIFGTPRRGKLRPKDVAYLDTFVHSKVPYLQHEIQLYTKGTGPLHILLLHGWESNSARWKHALDYIEKKIDCTIYMIDAPAHGGSSGKEFNSILYAQYIHTILQQYSIDVLIGHSIGAGSIAYCLSEIAAYPKAKLIIMGSPNTFTEIMNTYIKIIGLGKTAQRAMKKAIVHKYNLKHSDYVVAHYASNIKNETLIIHDINDNVSPIINARHIAEAIPTAQQYITHDYGHSLQSHSVFKRMVSFIMGEVMQQK